MPKDAPILDFSEPKIRQMVIAHIRNARGYHHFDIRKVRKNRTLPQNAYYWGCVLKAVQAGLREAWGETMSIDEVHVMMRIRFLSRPVVDRKTGEEHGTRIESTAALDLGQFCEYLDQIIKFAAEYLNVEVPPATPDTGAAPDER